MFSLERSDPLPNFAFAAGWSHNRRHRVVKKTSGVISKRQGSTSTLQQDPELPEKLLAMRRLESVGSIDPSGLEPHLALQG
jgi:hypothetical protein